MPKQISLDTRKIILDLHKEGYILRGMGKIVGRSHVAVKKLLDKFRNHKTLENISRPGRPKRLSSAKKKDSLSIK